MWSLREVSAVIALFVVLFCGQALAAGERGSSDTDKPVAVTLVRKKVSTSLIGSCSAVTTIHVRLQSVKSSTTSFSRVFMYMPTIETYASKLDNGTAKDIGGCAEMADNGGFAGFSFIDGLCKMFSPGRQSCRCDAGTGDVIYVRDSFWDPQEGRPLPKLVPVGTELIEYVSYPSTVFDEKSNIEGYFSLYETEKVMTDAQVMSALSMLENKGMFTVFSRGDKWVQTTLVDTEHCSMGCDRLSSNFIVRRLFTHNQKPLDEIAPQKFLLSECGNTFALKAASRIDFLMSHEGYGCRWYTKEAQDHECTVTLELSSSVAIYVLALSLDGDSTTCEGDTLTFNKATPVAGTLVKKFTACENKLSTVKPFGAPAGKIGVVLKRSSRQYQPKGFNFGFLLMLVSKG